MPLRPSVHSEDLIRHGTHTAAIPLVKVAMPPREQLMPALEQVLYSGHVAEGPLVQDFESRFAAAFGLPNVVATSSGSGALHVALALAGVKPGDEVISTSMTAEPTNTVILQTGAVPVFADVDIRTGNLAPEAVERAITPATRAIVVVHYAGYPADMASLSGIARQHGLKLIEDCAHALGAQAAGRPIGSWGDYALFSFQAIKHLTTVDGGMLAVTNGHEVPLARQLRWFGLTRGVPRTEVDIKTPGFKYNMNSVTATLGLLQLDGIGARVQAHVANAEFFNTRFGQASHVQPASFLSQDRPSYWLYTLLCEDATRVEQHLQQNGVTASKLHRPNHWHTVFQPTRHALSGTEHFYQRLLHIPCGWWLQPGDRERIADLVLEAR